MLRTNVFLFKKKILHLNVTPQKRTTLPLPVQCVTLGSYLQQPYITTCRAKPNYNGLFD